jgi:hypothetical protein
MNFDDKNFCNMLSLLSKLGLKSENILFIKTWIFLINLDYTYDPVKNEWRVSDEP